MTIKDDKNKSNAAMVDDARVAMKSETPDRFGEGTSTLRVASITEFRFAIMGSTSSVSRSIFGRLEVGP